LVIGLPVAGVAFWVMRTGICNTCLKFCPCLGCGKQNNEENIAVQVYDSSPNKTTQKLNAETALCDEDRMKECRTSLAVSRNYLDPSNVLIEMNNSQTGICGICGMCKRSDANLCTCLFMWKAKP
jgi:hypothetical protein